MDPKEVDRILKEKVAELKGQKNQEDIFVLITLLGMNLSDELKKAIEEIQIPAPVMPPIVVPEIKPPVYPEIIIPEIKIPEIKLPTINVPAPQVTVNVPKIDLPTINVPEPKVTVNIPKTEPPIVNIPPFPERMDVTGTVGLTGIDKKTPLPVMMMDAAGKPMSFSQGGGGGGRADFFTIKDIQNSTGGSLIDVDGNLKVSGNFSVTSSVTSTIAQIGNSDGDFSVSNPLPITGSISTTPGATFYASDAVGSVNVIQSVPIDVRQVSGVSFSTDVLSMPAVTVTSITNSVAATLIDSSGVGYSGSNPLPITGNITTSSGPVGQGDEATAARVVIAGNSAASVSATQVGTWNITTLTGITNSVASAIIDSSGVQYSTSNPFPVVITSGAAATSASNIVDSSGVAYSGSNPVPVTGTVAVSGVTGSIGATILNGEGVSRDTWGSSQVGTWNIATLTGITNSLAIVNLDRDGNPWAPYTFDNGDAATAQRVVVAGNSSASVSATQTGTWNITTLTGITNSLASSLVDSSGVQYSGSNPVPTKEIRAATGTNTSVADNAASVTILASNTARLGATVYNDSSATLYLILGSTAASTTNYTCKIVSSGYYEVPFGYTGQLTGIWASDPGDGAARVTEIT
jgi:hypothetical protein